MKDYNKSEVTLEARGPNGSGKTVFLTKIKEFLINEGLKVTGDPTEHVIKIKWNSKKQH